MYRCLIQTVGPVKVSYDSAGFDYLVECPDVSLFRAKGLADALAMAQLISDSMGDPAGLLETRMRLHDVFGFPMTRD